MTVSEGVPQRRVGTFTLGAVLVTAGCWMLGSLFWPRLDIGWMLRLSPVILIALGVEVLLAARGGGRIKYDWLGMLLCFLLVGAGLCMYAAAWYYENGEYFNAYDCSRWADETGYRMSYEYFDGFDAHTMYLEEGDLLAGQVDTRSGWLEVEVSGGDGETLYEARPAAGEQSMEIPKSGEYTILVHGQRTSGSFVFQVEVPETAESGDLAETLETPDAGGLEETPEFEE